eukprot:PITA_35585
MVDEIESLHKNKSWDLVELSTGKKPIGKKWVFKKKTNAEGKVEKYKAWLVAKGYSQVSRIDFGDVFSPVAKVTFIRLILFVVATFDFEVEKMDVKTSFLHEDLEEGIYMKQPEGFVVKDLKNHLSSNFDMKDLGAANYILGMEIKRDRTKRKLWLNQRKYVEEILYRFNMQDSKSVKVPIPVGVKLSVEQCPKTQEEEEDMSRVPYASVVDWDGDLDQRRSTSGYVFNLFGGAVNWMSKKQSVVALSTTEAEYMAATHASKEAVWLQRLCSSMGLVQGALRIDCDSQSAIFLAKNPAYHSKTKHIDGQCHFVRDMIEDKNALLVKVDTLKSTADALTKSASSEKFSWCRETMGVAGLDK